MRYPISDNARELAITDFRFSAQTYALLTDRSGRSYLVYAPVWAAPKPQPHAPALPAPAPEAGVAAPTRRVAEWALYALWGAAAAAAIWFVFLPPRAQGPPPPVRPMTASFESFSASLARATEH
jgi:hypothetical protein